MIPRQFTSTSGNTRSARIQIAVHAAPTTNARRRARRELGRLGRTQGRDGRREGDRHREIDGVVVAEPERGEQREKEPRRTEHAQPSAERTRLPVDQNAHAVCSEGMQFRGTGAIEMLWSGSGAVTAGSAGKRPPAMNSGPATG